MSNVVQRPPRRILIASANPLFSKGLGKLLAHQNSQPAPEMRLASTMVETLGALRDWLPDLVVVDYDDSNINRSEFLNHFVSSNAPMQVMLVSLQASGEVVVYDRRTLTPAQAETWLSSSEDSPEDQQAAVPILAVDQTPNIKRKSGFLKPRWILLSLLVLLVIAVFIRLGFWQLDRLAQRRALNARVEAVINQPALDLNQNLPTSAVLSANDYRSVVVRGEYDSSQEVILVSKVWNDQLGAHILTPLKIQGSSLAVLVDRGWIPFEKSAPADRQQYNEAGVVTVKGMLRNTQTGNLVGANNTKTTNGWQDGWRQVDIGGIQKQVNLTLLPVYIIQAPDPSWTKLPYRSLPDINLTEGPHLGYAIQWFAFALILGLGFPLWLRRNLQMPAQNPQGNSVKGRG